MSNEVAGEIAGVILLIVGCMFVFGLMMLIKDIIKYYKGRN